MDKKFNNIDQIARDALDDFEVDFNPDDWKLMEEKLDKKEHLMPYIWLYKGLEASLLLLILFTGVHFLYQNTNSGNHQSDVNSNSPQQTFAEQQEIKGTNSTDKTLATLSNNSSKEEHYSNENSSDETLNADKKEAVLKNRTEKTVNTKTLGTKTPKVQNRSKEKSRGSETFIPTQKENSLDLDKEDFAKNHSPNLAKDQISAEVGSMKLTKDGGNFISFTEIAAIDLKKALADNHGGDDEDVISIHSKYRYPKIYSPKMHLAIFAGADYSMATSEGIAQMGITFGASLETEINKRFSLSYGIVASRKKFEDYYQHEIDRTATEGVMYTQTVERRAALSTVQVPIFANLMLFENTKWELNASVGLAGHILATRFVEGSTRTAVQQTAGGLVNIAEINSDAQEKGAFEGGSFNRNIFATVGLGLSLERQLSDDFKLFLNPQYQHALNSIGDHQDRLSGFTLLVGLKKAL